MHSKKERKKERQEDRHTDPKSEGINKYWLQKYDTQCKSFKPLQ